MSENLLNRSDHENYLNNSYGEKRKKRLKRRILKEKEETLAEWDVS